VCREDEVYAEIRVIAQQARVKTEQVAYSVLEVMKLTQSCMLIALSSTKH
jgi:hypothetical protein